MQPPQPTAWPFDAAPLVAPVEKAAVKAHAQQMRTQGRLPKNGMLGMGVVAIAIGVVAFLVIGGIFFSIVGTIFGAIITAGTGDAGVGIASLGFLVPVIFIGGIFALIVFAVVRSTLGQPDRWYRLDHFAQRNGMTYQPFLENPALPGMIFGNGHSRRSSDLVRGTTPRFVEFANYTYKTGSGKNESTHRWGYVAIRLDVPLPHIVLDALGNNALFGSNLPASFDKDQRLSLEGDFDRYFSLFCPAGYESDALYLFTPDIMARFIDNAAALDVEIVDDWLFLYGKRDFSTLDPATWAWLFSAVSALLDKFAQWARWRDDRLAMDAGSLGATAPSGATPGSAASAGAAASALPFTPPTQALRPPPGVAQAGRRLTRRTPWIAIIVVVGFALFWIIGQTGAMAAFFGSFFGG